MGGVGAVERGASHSGDESRNEKSDERRATNDFEPLLNWLSCLAARGSGLILTIPERCATTNRWNKATGHAFLGMLHAWTWAMANHRNMGGTPLSLSLLLSNGLIVAWL